MNIITPSIKEDHTAHQQLEQDIQKGGGVLMNTLLIRKRVLLFLALLLIVMKVPVSLAQTECSINREKEKALHNLPVIPKKTIDSANRNDFLTKDEYQKILRTFSSISPLSHVLPTEEQYIGALRRLFQKHPIYHF